MDTMTMTIRVSAIEDDARYRESLAALFTHAPGFSWGGSFARPSDALEAVAVGIARGEEQPWDLMLMDLDLPGMHGVEVTRQLKQMLPGLQIVVLTVFEDVTSIVNAICAGADGYLLKRTSANELVHQLEGIVAGGAPLTAGVARTILEVVRTAPPTAGGSRGEAPSLTEREKDVLQGLVNGRSYKQVGDELGVSLDTVRSHIRSIYRKLQVHSVAEAVSRALRERLV